MRPVWMSLRQVKVTAVSCQFIPMEKCIFQLRKCMLGAPFDLGSPCDDYDSLVSLTETLCPAFGEVGFSDGQHGGSVWVSDWR